METSMTDGDEFMPAKEIRSQWVMFEQRMAGMELTQHDLRNDVKNVAGDVTEIKDTVRAFRKEVNGGMAEMGERVGVVERWMWVGIGGIGVLTFLMAIGIAVAGLVLARV